MNSINEDKCYISVFVNGIQVCSLADLKRFLYKIGQYNYL